MTGKDFFKSLANGKVDIVQTLIEFLADILRLIETYPELENNLPRRLKEELNKE
ncbi:MAG: hypothetical protein MUF69_14515 [Desulfobacterota bacterium]|jgi:hypothetical protein|nr:hypothetical protein [Thermodesulfobacteriota bacterium]